MDNALDSDRLRHLYLTKVKPNGNDIGVSAYGRVFEVEYCGTVYAAKEVHAIFSSRSYAKRIQSYKESISF